MVNKSIVKTTKAIVRKPAKTKALTKVEKRQVATIAKRVLKSNNEHKYIVKSVEEANLYCMEVYALNPMGSISVGTGFGQRIGEVINNVKLRVKFSYIHRGIKIDLPNVRQWQQSKLRVMVVRTKRQLTTNDTALSLITSQVGRTDSATNRENCLFYQPDGWTYPYHSALEDTRKDNGFRVVMDKVVSSQLIHGYSKDLDADFIPNGMSRDIKFSINLGKYEYRENSTAYAKDGYENTYVLFTPYIPKTLAGTDLAGALVMHYSLAWTDS